MAIAIDSWKTCRATSQHIDFWIQGVCFCWTTSKIQVLFILSLCTVIILIFVIRGLTAQYTHDLHYSHPCTIMRVSFFFHTLLSKWLNGIPHEGFIFIIFSFDCSKVLQASKTWLHFHSSCFLKIK